MSGAWTKVGTYLFLTLTIGVVLRLYTHVWPPVFLLVFVGGGAYTVWRKEQALEKRLRLSDLQEAEQHGKYGKRHYWQ